MIALGNATTTITATLSGAVSTNQAMCTVVYEDEPSTVTGTAVAIHDKQLTLTNSATPVTILAAGPGGTANFRRRVKSIFIFNNDTAAITIALKLVDTAGSTMTLQQVTLQTLEQLNYEEGFGFLAIDVNGAEKSQAAATSSATSTADSKAVSVSVIASANLSTTTSQSTLTSSALVSLSVVTSANLSTTTSQSTLVSSGQVSLSVVASTNLSTFTAASSTTSSQLSLQTSAGTSVTLSKTKSSFGF